MSKEELRSLFKQIRLRMSSSEVSSKSRLIGRKLLNEINWNSYAKICLYLPLQNLNEVDINGVISRLKAQRRDVTVLSNDKKARAPQKSFDLIIVPCLAYDSANYRLGWGGGFYDKFLAKQPDALKVGVCFYSGFVDGGLPHEPHDIPLDQVITEL